MDSHPASANDSQIPMVESLAAIANFISTTQERLI